MEIRVLGPIAAETEDPTVDLTSPKLRRLLAVLAASANEVVSIDRLVEHVWSEAEPDQAVRTLRTHVWRLRLALKGRSGECIVTQPPGYRLSLSVDEFDAAAFERDVDAARRLVAVGRLDEAVDGFDAALARWRGDAFGEFAQEAWAQPAAVRLENLRAVALEQRIDTLLDAGRHASAVGDIENLIARHPLRERPRAQLMIALYRSGQQPGALRAYQSYRTYLGEELGLEPSPELQRLEQAIAVHDSELVSSAQIERVVRGYRLVDRLSSSDQSVTYRARQRDASRDVALTIIDADASNDADFVRGFEARARRVARLGHPNILPLIDFWRDARGSYVVSAHIDGRERPSAFDISSFLSFVEQVGSALTAAHDAGVVHGRIRFESVSFAAPDQARLGGFFDAFVNDPRSEHAVSGDVADLARLARDMAPRDLPIAVTSVLERAAAGGKSFTAEDFVNELRVAAKQPFPFSPIVRNPFVGLRAFGEADAGQFFGRERTVKELVETMSRRGDNGRFVALVGTSGSGKSSVIRAGLLPALRAGAVEGSGGWFIAAMVPSDDPFAALERALEPVSAAPPHSIGELLRREGDALSSAAEVLLPDREGELLLFVDQFEELFTSVEDDTVRVRFMNLICDAAQNARSRVRVVITLRADFYDRPLRYRRFGRLLDANHSVLTPLDEEELRSAIESPPRLVGLRLEPGLASTIVADAAAGLNSLPLVQHTMADLFDRHEDGTITAASYREIGGVAGSLAQRTEQTYLQLSEAEREAARRMFVRLVTLGEGVPDTRRRVERQELLTLSSADAVERAIEAFGSARLLTFDHVVETREPTVEIAHEALILGWPRLRAWIDEDREGLRLTRHLSNAARAWDARDRDAAELYRGDRLESALDYSATRRGDLTQTEQAFLDASRAERDAQEEQQTQRMRHQQQQNRRLRRLLAVAAVATVVAIVAGIVASVQNERAQDQRDVATTQRVQTEKARAAAEIDRMVARSISDANDTPDRALLLAAEAYQRDPSVKTSGALQSAIVAQPKGFLGFIPATGESAQVVYGERVLLRHTYRSVQIIDVATRTIRAEIADDTTNVRVALSRGDQFLALGGTTVRVFDAMSGVPVGAFAEAANAVDLAFDPSDPERLIVGNADGSATTYLWRTSAVATKFPKNADTVRRVVPSPDGRYLAVSTAAGDSTLKLFDLRTGAALTGHLGRTLPTISYPMDLTFDRSSTRLASVDRNGDGRVFSVPDGKLISTTKRNYGYENAYSIRFADERTLVVGTTAGVLQRWSAATGEHLDSTEPHVGLINSIDVNPSNSQLAVGGANSTALLALDGAGSIYRTLPYPPGLAAVASTGADVTLSFDSAGSRLLANAGGRLWTWKLGAPVDSVQPFETTAADGIVIAATLTPDGGAIVMQQLDLITRTATISFRSATTFARTGQPIATPLLVSYSVSPDGKWLAITDVTDVRRPGGVRLFDLASGTLRKELIELNAITQDVDLLRGSQIMLTTFSADSKRLAAANHRGAAMIWDLDTLQPLSKPISTGGGAVLNDLAFMPDGQHIALISNRNDIELRDIATMALDGESLSGHSSLAESLSFDPSGKRLLTTSGTGVQLWDLTARLSVGQPFPTPIRLSNGNPPVWLPGGAEFAYAARDGIVVWSVDPAVWLTAACRLAGRNLTDSEWNTYGPGPDVPRHATC